MVKLGKSQIGQLPVVSRTDTSKLLGILTMPDIVRTLASEIDSPAEMSRHDGNPSE